MKRAGWIIQFNNCHFEKKDAGGQVVQSWDMVPRHTAIIERANGTMVTLLHQNAGGDGKVREDTLDLTWLVKPSNLPYANNYTLFIPQWRSGAG